MIEKLACKLGLSDEGPNIQLAQELCESMDASGIREIVDGLTMFDSAVANDCIKVLYEIGKQRPELIADYAGSFISCLRSRNNRLVWGSMTALANITQLVPEVVFESLTIVVTAYREGSVITIDQSISVFAELCKAGEQFAQTVLPIIINHLSQCRPKDVPQHGERASVCFNPHNAGTFIEVLEERMPHLIPSGQVRVTRLLKRLYKERGVVDVL